MDILPLMLSFFSTSGTFYMKEVNDLFPIVSHLVDYNDRDWDTLQEEAENFAEWIPELVQAFYDTLYAHESTQSIFHENERPAVEKTLTNWLASLASGVKQEAFWNHQWLIALLHIKRDVKNIYMLGMMNRVQQIVLKKCLDAYDKDRAYEVYSAFIRITGIVAALIAECYDILQRHIAEDGLSKVGMPTALYQRIRGLQLEIMLKEVDRPA